MAYRLYGSRVKKINKQITSFVVALVLTVTSLSGGLPLWIAGQAAAAPGIVYPTTGFSSLSWSADRTAPSGGYTVSGNSLDLRIDNSLASSTTGFYRTEGLQANLPAGIKTIKANLYIDSAWANIPVRAGLWGVSSDGSNTAWPIIEYASNIDGYTGIRVYDTNTGEWYQVASTVSAGSTVPLEIAINTATNTYDFYANSIKVKSYPSYGYNSLTNVIVNSFNSALASTANYTAHWTGLALGITPTTTACSGTTTLTSTSLSGWITSETRPAGHNQLLANGLHIWTDTDVTGSPDPRKAAAYSPTSFPLSGVGNQTIAQSIDYQATSGITPGLQLAVDFDHNGTVDGILVGESVYGNDWWLSGSAQQFVKDGTPNNSGGYGSQWHGTINEWLNQFPDAQVLQIGYSLGSGVNGNGVIKRITLGCTNYTFGLGTPSNLTPINGTYTNDPGFVNTWSAVDGAVGYEYRTANTLSGSELGTIIYHDSSATQPERYATSAGVVTRQNGGAPEAPYYWQVRAIDSYGNPGPWSVINKVTVDTTTPTVSIKTDAGANDGSLGTNPYSRISFKLYDKNGNLKDVTINGHTYIRSGTWNDLNWVNIAKSNLVDGLNTVVVRDLAGNQSQLTFNYDTIPPTITVKPESVGSGTIFQKASFKLYDAQQVDKVAVNGVVKDLTNNTWSDLNDVKPGVFGAVEGANTIVLYDVAGNTTTYNFTLDTVAPVSVLTTSIKPYFTKLGTPTKTLAWTTSTSSDVDHYEYAEYYNTSPTSESTPENWLKVVNGTSTTDTAWQSDITIYWRVRAVDHAGNKSTWSDIGQIISDVSAPIVTVKTQSTTNTEPTLIGTVSEANITNTVIRVKVNGHTYTAILGASQNLDGSYPWSVNVTDALPLGTYDVTASATDPAGNIGTDATTNELTITTSLTSSTTSVLGLGTQTPQQASRTTHTTGSSAAVLGTETTTPTKATSTSNTGKVQGASTTSDTTSLSTNAPDDTIKNSNFLGLGWWWLLVVALLGFFWFLFGKRKKQDDK